ncbi:hypothetical protein A2851_03465 [Candidatus Kaiserbacteria bacterium RIFCSPHIGHO2_01_FULL_53_29]|uniref:Serine aminopeptidase S33 domain-containing protein n=1 Tax=Candidatus Kaiserbacteria bacterium RIFCSPHIGHO2_01_FULL_53_29 TaxID=1798480 RepID=A0A1F6CXU7_9BACT|nr:MAG: hypothetical protein A2851_03465 [Candidatus Kaiserbacteria bacterium RIFCSPHIGHO2_01_FULL_53_29]
MKKIQMRAAYVVEIVTPKKFILNGLWFGPKKPKRVIIWIHGLGSSMFGKLLIADELVDHETAVLVFNNRGHNKVASVSGVGGKRIKGGAAHEVFTDCIDDIEGAINFARHAGVKNIYLAGHSTGSQKSAYWGYKKGKRVKGIILLAPMSDYSAATMLSGKRAVTRAAEVARKLVRKGRAHDLLPADVWDWKLLADAQRFLSLYSGESVEELFPYSQPHKNPTALKKSRVPTLVLLAEKDEFADRPAKKIAEWFDGHIRAPHRVVIVPKVPHSFKDGEKEVARAIRQFLRPRKTQ